MFLFNRRPNTPIIDAHVHLLKNNPSLAVQELLDSMDRSGIKRAMVLAMDGHGVSTDDVLTAIAPHRDRLFAIAAASPNLSSRSLETLKRWLADGTVRGVKFYVGYESYYPNDDRIWPILKTLVAYGRPAIFHSGDCADIGQPRLKYAHPLVIDDVAMLFPELNIIIAHLGSPWTLDAGQVLWKNPNVYADISGFVNGRFRPSDTKRFAHLLEHFLLAAENTDKLLFGTDWPISEQDDYVRVAAKFFGRNNRRLFHDNAAKLFGLD